jgi:hypothetical protein
LFDIHLRSDTYLPEADLPELSIMPIKREKALDELESGVMFMKEKKPPTLY